MRMLESPGFAYRHGEWQDDFPGSQQLVMDLPPPFGRCRVLSVPAAEIITIPRHLELREVRVFFSLPPMIAKGAAFALPWLRRLARTPLRSLLHKIVGSGTSGPDEATRKSDQFHILIDVRGVRQGSAAVQRLLISGVDPYGLTAVIAAAAALRMNDPAYAKSGVLAPAQAFEPRAVLEDCAALGLRWEMLPS
jgi:short subunit dehydrogenase-like uncharacterized protein